MSFLIDRNVALIGFMTAGKSQVGQRLSWLTGMPFCDVDVLIEGLEGRPVHEIFATKGEPYFRALESQVLNQLCQGQGQIIGCGGGTILAAENRALLRQRCVTVWLRVSEHTVLDRLELPGNPRRPLLEGRDTPSVVHDLFVQREPLYAEADHVLDADGAAVAELADRIALRLGLPTAPR